MKELTVIIINYQSTSDILDCLRSAHRFSSASSFEWIIVNNDAAGAESGQILHEFPQVRWIEMGYNAGFARANNTGMKLASGDAVLLLNPDTIILDDAIAGCYQRLKSVNCIAAAVQLQNEDGSPQITGNYFMKGGLNHLLPLPYIGPFLRWIAFAVNTKKTNILSASAHEKVDWITGAFLMVKKSAIEKAGMMDEDFFLYSEETEWCSRLGKYGDLCVFGDLHTIHKQGESINRATDQQQKGYAEITGKKGLQLIVSQHLRIRKQFGKGWFLLHLMIYSVAIPISFLLSFFDNLFRLRNPFKDWPRAASFASNVSRLWLLSRKIWKNKPYFYKMF